MTYKFITPVTGIGEIASYYDGYILDIWGVIHNGIDSYPGVVECLKRLKDLKKEIFYLTNIPRPGYIAEKFLNSIGIEVEKGHLLSSGDAVRHELLYREDEVFQNLGENFFHLGAEYNTDILRDLNKEPVETLKEADFVLLSLFLDNYSDYETKYAPLFEEALKRNLPFICANPDEVTYHGKNLRFCAGTFAKEYEKKGGVVHYYGKPYPIIYHQVFEKLKEKGIIDKSKILMVGDTPHTDIAGARSVGIDSALAMTGILREKFTLDEQGLPPLDELQKYCEEKGPIPTWVVPGFRW